MAHANKLLTNDDKPPGSLSIALKVKTLLGTSLKKERKEQNRLQGIERPKACIDSYGNFVFLRPKWKISLIHLFIKILMLLGEKKTSTLFSIQQHAYLISRFG